MKRHKFGGCWRLPYGLLLVAVWVGTAAVAVAEDDQVARPRQAALGRIYVHAILRLERDDPDNVVRGIISIDPASGKWKQLTEYGHGMRVSPDGETLVFTRDNELWSCDTREAANPGRLAKLRGKLSWTHDGKHIVVSSGNYQEGEGQDEGWKCETVKVSSDGLLSVPLAIPDTDFVEDWSPVANLVVTSSDRHPPRGRGYQLYVMRPDGSEQRRVTRDGLNVGARFSPDGKRIAYVHQDKQGNSLRITDIEGSQTRTLLRESGYSNSTDSVAWSPDGRQFAVGRFDWGVDEESGRRVVRNPEEANHRIELIDDQGTLLARLDLADAEVIWLGNLEWR